MANDTKKLIIGCGDFSLIIGAVAAAAAEALYDADSAQFGNINSITPIREATKVEHMGSYNGVKIRDDIHVTALKSGFKISGDEMREMMYRAMYFAGAGVDHTDPAFTVYTPQTQAIPLKGYGRLRIYDGRTQDGVPRIKWIDFACIVEMTTPPTFDGETYSNYEAEVHILSDVGQVIVRKTEVVEEGGMI
jgi:hypothetical protein